MSQDADHPTTPGPSSARPPFSFCAETRVAFSDTDAQGIVYYGRYAPYFDLARVEYWRHLGFQSHDTPDRGEFVMRAFDIEYHAPARFDDVLEVYCRVARVGRTSLGFEFAVVLGDDSDTLLATATQVMVNVDLARRRPVEVAPSVREAISTFENLDDPAKPRG